MTITGAQITTMARAAGAGSGMFTTPAKIANLFNDAMGYAPGSFNTKNKVAALLATCLQESAYFRTTEEYAKNGRYAPYIGRTMVQVTWKDNYRKFGAWCKSKGLVSNANYFVNNPKQLANQKWAALGGVWYFTQVKFSGKPLTDYAGSILQVSKAVNLGNPFSSATPNGMTARRKAFNAVKKAGVTKYTGKTKGATASKTVKKSGTFTKGGTAVDMKGVTSKGTKVKFRNLTSTNGKYPGCACPCLTHVVALAEALLHERKELRPDQKLQTSQGSWSKGVAASAGVHDAGGTLDIHVKGYTTKGKKQVVKALRESGGIAYRRGPGFQFGDMSNHIHLVVAGCGHANRLAKNQIKSYRNGRNALRGNMPDPDIRVPFVTWKQAWKKLTKTTTVSAATEEEGFDMLKQRKTLKRTKNQTIGGKYKALRYSNKKSSNLTFFKGGGAKVARIRLGLDGLTADDSVRVCVYRIDKKKGKNSKHTNYPVVDLPGGNGRVYRDVWFRWVVPAPPKGTKRYMRVKAYSRSGNPVKVRHTYIKRWA